MARFWRRENEVLFMGEIWESDRWGYEKKRKNREMIAYLTKRMIIERYETRVSVPSETCVK